MTLAALQLSTTIDQHNIFDEFDLYINRQRDSGLVTCFHLVIVGYASRK